MIQHIYPETKQKHNSARIFLYNAKFYAPVLLLTALVVGAGVLSGALIAGIVVGILTLLIATVIAFAAHNYSTMQKKRTINSFISIDANDKLGIKSDTKLLSAHSKLLLETTNTLRLTMSKMDSNMIQQYLPGAEEVYTRWIGLMEYAYDLNAQIEKLKNIKQDDVQKLREGLKTQLDKTVEGEIQQTYAHLLDLDTNLQAIPAIMQTGELLASGAKYLSPQTTSDDEAKRVIEEVLQRTQASLVAIQEPQVQVRG